VDVAVFAISEFAPAKINLALHVTGRRPDGYHLLETLVVFAGIGDRVRVQPSARDRFSVEGPFSGDLPAKDCNLATRARNLLRAHCISRLGAEAPPVFIHLEKNLPVASGIGGGSSDAAATLKALNRAWRLGLSPDRLAEISGPLGADLPMCIHARPLIARGAGEQTEPFTGLPVLNMVLVNPGVPVSTPEVFRTLASRENAPMPRVPAGADFDAFANWLAATRNDLEMPAIAIAPPIARALAALRASGAAIARMSGSGATCFGLFSDRASAEAAARSISQAEPGWFVSATQSMMPT
jgi:4-diphosphocytidyl-2-C-methyl-D-erythritol kinase